MIYQKGKICNKKEMTLDRRLATVRSRVISVLSWYLTSLINLSFCRFTISQPALWRISVITDNFNSYPLSGMLLCVGFVFQGGSYGVTGSTQFVISTLQRPKISNSHSLYSSRRYWHLLSRCFFCLRFLVKYTSYFLNLWTSAFCWFLSLWSLPVHWYHLFCLKLNTENRILQYGMLYKMHYRI